MKGTWFAAITTILTLALVLPSTTYADHGNRAKGIGRIICTPLKAVKDAAQNTIKTITLQKPAAILSVPKLVRQDTLDLAESVGRVIVGQEPIEMEGVGSLNTKITDAGIDWLVDGVFYGVIVGASVHNSMETGPGHHYLLDWKAGSWTAGGVIVSDLLDGAANNEK